MREQLDRSVVSDKYLCESNTVERAPSPWIMPTEPEFVKAWPLFEIPREPPVLRGEVSEVVGVLCRRLLYFLDPLVAIVEGSAAMADSEGEGWREQPGEEMNNVLDCHSRIR
mmetsp:Transcript_41037/g.55927  ORF Transcript_41037/g.55927 Transcript_41037/m.55927 type:complete len:112 (-) Transcript_41037:298-633(-)